MIKIVAGSLIQVTMGMDTGRVGTVIGVRGREYPILVVFFEDNLLDICVLPETVRVLSQPHESDVIWLSDDEMQQLFACE